jgi:ribonuclease J
MKNRKIADDVVIDRQTMANEGVVMIVAQISESDREISGPIRVSSFGMVDNKFEKSFAQEIQNILENFIEHIKVGILQNTRAVEDDLRKVVRKHCIRKYRKYPMIVPTIFVQ